MRKSRVTERVINRSVGKVGREPETICPLCGGEMEVDPESGETHCPVCEDNEK